MMTALDILFGIFFLMLICTLGCAIALMIMWMRDKQEERRNRRASSKVQHPSTPKCPRCHKVHAGPEDCERWSDVM